MTDTALLTRQSAESNCWQRVCAQLKKLDIDIDHADGLADSLVDWGERISQLRELTGQVYTNGQPQLTE